MARRWQSDGNSSTGSPRAYGFIFRWMVENYVDSALMLLRRELDRQDGTENLLNLLSDSAL